MELHPLPWTQIQGTDTVDASHMTDVLRLIAIDLLIPNHISHTSDAVRWLVDKMENDWRIVTPKGRLAKRLNNLLYKEWKITLTPQLLDMLAVAIGNSSMPACQARITDRLDWQDGDYMDDDSCFWYGRKGDRAALVASGTMALQLRSSDGQRGLGRAFLLPHEGIIYLLNAYGYRMPMMLSAYRQLTGYEGPAPYTHLVLPIGKTGGTVYINDGALAIGKEGVDDGFGDDTTRITTQTCRCTHEFDDLHYAYLQPVCARCPFHNGQEEIAIEADENAQESLEVAL